MAESQQFLKTLDHSNPARPKFSIKRGVYPQLVIEFAGQQMEVPMAEILLFARRWEADWQVRMEAQQAAGGLGLFPYSIMGGKLDDPDLVGLKWWVPE